MPILAIDKQKEEAAADQSAATMFAARV